MTKQMGEFRAHPSSPSTGTNLDLGKPITCNHVQGPQGYVQRINWLEHMSARYTQEQCPKCGLWAIWRITTVASSGLEPSKTRQNTLKPPTEENTA